MKIKKPILIVLGEPNSVFIEILSKVISKTAIKKTIKYPIILIGSKNLILSHLKKMKLKLKFKTINLENFKFENFKNLIYLIDVKYKFEKPFEPISAKSKKYISNCFNIAISLLNNNFSKILINGPISKKHFLQNKYPGITEYIFNKSKIKISKNPVMLLYNRKLSVSPMTTHIPLKDVSKNLNKKIIVNNILNIKNFYKKMFKFNPKISVLGVNPHCETNSKLNEDKNIIEKSINELKKKNVHITGPYPADTFFMKKNYSNYNVVVGMYHDQVLTPFKTLFEFNASNITLGLPFLRMSVDHGPNESMLGKNKSNTKSLENIFHFINSIK